MTLYSLYTIAMEANIETCQLNEASGSRLIVYGCFCCHSQVGMFIHMCRHAPV